MNGDNQNVTRNEEKEREDLADSSMETSRICEESLTQMTKSIIHHNQASMAMCFNKRVKTRVKNREPIHSSFLQRKPG